MSTPKNKSKRKTMETLEPGDLIPMSGFQREFLKLHDKYVHNPEMELILASNEPTDRRMNFGANPLPWELSMTNQDTKHLKQAQQKLYVCKNLKCKNHEKEATADYCIVKHKREIPHSCTGDSLADQIQNKVDLKRFGRREQLDIHVAVQCKECKGHIQFVKSNISNRRAAKDPMVSGPHQRTHR